MVLDYIISALLTAKVQTTTIYEPQEIKQEISTTLQTSKRRSMASNEKKKGMESVHSEIQTQICQVFVNNCQEAIAIAKCENRTFNPQAVGYNSNGSRDYSIFQINDIHFKKIPGRTYEDKVAFITMPDNNIRFAYELFKQQGFNPWICKKVLAMK